MIGERGASVRHHVVIERPAAVVWRLAGDPARLAEWFPGIVACHVDGDQRVITTGTGMAMPEQILERDPLQRRFRYRITAPIFRHHQGTIDVLDLPDDRCVAVYATECDPATMALVIGGATHAALQELKRLMEAEARARGGDLMGRKILFVTTDQQRYDTLGCNGGTVAHTPVADRLAGEGIRYERAHPQSVVCMPSRATIITGQHPSTHGVWMNGVPLPVDAPSVAALLYRAGYRTALIGKAHFEPFLDPFGRFTENRLARDGVPTVDEPWFDGTIGPHRGFEHLELATHNPAGPLHYSRWLAANHPEAVGGFYPVLDASLQVNALGGGDTGAPQAYVNPIPRAWYHTDWVADRTIAWLDTLPADADWFCWMSFPDPHHPWDPPADEMRRIDWRDVPLPAGYPEAAAERERILDAKPRHWRQWYDGTLVSNYEAPADWVPATLTADQVREVNARNAVECELIDEALGRVLAAAAARGWGDDVDVLFTTDHGELQGDFGLLFKGPYHVDALLRLPLIWRPARSAGTRAAAVVTRPVGLVDLAPTFCSIAGVHVPSWMEGAALPTDDADADARGFERVLTEWDSELFGVDVHLRTITRDGWVCTTYRPGHRPRRHGGRALLAHRRPAAVDEPLGRIRACAAPGRPRRRPPRPPARADGPPPLPGGSRLNRGGLSGPGRRRPPPSPPAGGCPRRRGRRGRGGRRGARCRPHRRRDARSGPQHPPPWARR